MLFYSFQDECLQVRERFSAKLHKGLSRGIPHKCLPLDFMGLYALAGQEPDKRLKSTVRGYMAADILKRRDVIKSLLLNGGCEWREILVTGWRVMVGIGVSV